MNALATISVRSRSETYKALQYVKGLMEEKKTGDEYYRLDRLYLDRYLADVPEWEKKICLYFKELREQGERIVFVDICGRASALHPRADKNYSFSLQPLNRFAPLEDRKTNIVGDIFSARDFYSFLSLIRKNGDQPAFVAFLPVAGLQEYTPWSKGFDGAPKLHREVTFQRLANNLRKTVEILRYGGLMLIGPAFQFNDDVADFLDRKTREQWASTLQMKALCTELDCSTEIGDNLGSPFFLIRKRLPRGKRRISRP